MQVAAPDLPRAAQSADRILRCRQTPQAHSPSSRSLAPEAAFDPVQGAGYQPAQARNSL